MDLPNIERFCKDNGFKLELNGQIGFGRPCVGIMDPRTDSYIAYQYFEDEENFKGEHRHTIAEETAPANAYHKGEYLSVILYGDDRISLDEAVKRLDGWIGRILEVGYKVVEYGERGGLANLAMNQEVVVQRAVIDK